MTVRPVRPAARARTRRGLAAALFLAAALPAGPARGQPAEPRVPAGKCVSAPGTLLCREGAGPWKTAGEVHTRDVLLALAGIRADVEPASGTVRLSLRGNMPEQSPYPVLESSAVLHDSRAYDLDLTLLGGRAVLTSAKKDGPARVWLRMPGEGWEIALDGPGATVALERYGRWPRGVPFSKDPLSAERPTNVLSLQMLKGQAEVRFGGHQQRLTAPPGPASLHWDSIAGADAGPQRREKVPVWADSSAQQPDDVKILRDVAAKYLASLKDKNAPAALQALLTSADADNDKDRASLTREFAVLGMAATGALTGLTDALSTSHDHDVRLTAILALRHWIGSAPGRDLQLYQLLGTYANYPERQADTVMQLLHSPFDPNDPVSYQTLIAYLQHDKLAVRELARWHLYRLVPAGARIAYDANGSPEERAKAAKEWKALVPDGELPRRLKKEVPQKQTAQ